MAEEPKLSASPILSGDEVSNDAMQLILVSVFNGLCRVTRSLAQNGLLDAEQIENIHDAMTTPLDDPDLRPPATSWAASRQGRRSMERVWAATGRGGPGTWGVA